MARRRTRNMRLKPRMYMGKTPLRMSLYGFAVTASRDDVERFADQWPGSGMHGKPGFTAEFDSKGDLVGMSGWAYNFKGDQSALSAFIDDMKAYGQAAMASRKPNPRRRKKNWQRPQNYHFAGNPAARGKKRRRVVSKAQHRLLFAKMHRGEITQDQLWDMLHNTRKSYRQLPVRKGRDRYGRFVKGRRRQRRR